MIVRLGSISGARSRGVAKETVEHLTGGQTRPTGMDLHQRPFRVVEVLAEHEPDPPRPQVLVDRMEPATDHLVLLVGDLELLPALKRMLLWAPVLTPRQARPLDRVLAGLLAGQLAQLGRRRGRRRRRLQRIDLLGSFVMGQGGSCSAARVWLMPRRRSSWAPMKVSCQSMATTRCSVPTSGARASAAMRQAWSTTNRSVPMTRGSASGTAASAGSGGSRVAASWLA
jgi:hypothetical protein